MAQRRISRSDVFAAADKLREANRTITLETVRQELGSGSMSTISPLLKEWRQLAEPEYRTKASALPPALLDQLEKLWLSTKQDAQKQIEVAQARHREECEKLKADCAKLQTDVDVAMNENRRLNSKLRDKEKELAEVRNKKDELTLAKAKLSTQLDQANARIGDRDKEITRLHENNRSIENSLAKAHEHAANRLHQKELEFTSERSQYQHDIKELNIKLNQTEQNTTLLSQEKQSLSRALEDVTADNKEYQNKIANQTALLADTKVVQAQLEAKLDAKTEVCEKFEAAMKEQQLKIDHLQSSLAKINVDLSKAQNEVKLFKNKALKMDPTNS